MRGPCARRAGLAGAALGACLLLSACEKPANEAQVAAGPATPAASKRPDAGMPPPIVLPENGDDADSPSYEVAIATAAARRNQARKACDALPGREREDCVARAEEEFARERENLAGLRGNAQ